MMLTDYTVSQFRGMNTFVKDTKTLKPGIATENKNWLTSKFGDHIELRRGSALLGETRQTGPGKVTGLGVGIRYDGEQIPFFSHGRKVRYYNDSDDETHEVGTDLLPAAASGEDVWFGAYQNLAGSHMYLGSRSSGIYKIPVANPSSARDQSVSSFRFGHLRFNQGRAFAGQRNGTTAGNKDDTGVYLSDIDKALLSSFTQVTAEALGSSGSTTYSGTLAAMGTAGRTCMYIAIKEAGGETLLDDRNGNLVGDAGSTGTINYATGAFSVSFNHTTVGAVTADYYWELATSDGPLDFDTGSTGAGKAKIFRQDDGGGRLMAILPFLDVNYCLHELKTWALTTTLDDTSATNLLYRAIGIPYPRAACAGPEGILLIDTANPSDPKVRRLEIGRNTNNLTIVPTSISDALDLSVYDFSQAIAFRWGEYEIICCGEYVNGTANGHNSVMLVRNVASGAWDRLDYRVSCLDIFNGALIAGDAISNNVFTLFSGFDDDEAAIDNHWQDGQLNLRTDNLKVAHHMRVTGHIQRDQSIGVFLVLDDSAPVHVYTIEGDGSYVDQGINVSIGSRTIGSLIGGGGEETAHPFDITFPIHTDRFQYVSARFEAFGIGHGAVNSYTYKDIRDKGRRSLPVKTV